MAIQGAANAAAARRLRSMHAAVITSMKQAAAVYARMQRHKGAGYNPGDSDPAATSDDNALASRTERTAALQNLARSRRPFGKPKYI
jgi:hypothetical protein